MRSRLDDVESNILYATLLAQLDGTLDCCECGGLKRSELERCSMCNVILLPKEVLTGDIVDITFTVTVD